jgi:hypothetical protein
MIKKDMQSRHPERRTSSSQHLLAAAEASAITAMLTNPIWVVKTRVFGTAKSDAAAYRGLWGMSLTHHGVSCLFVMSGKHTAAEHGIMTRPHAVRDVAGNLQPCEEALRAQKLTVQTVSPRYIATRASEACTKAPSSR